MIDPNFFEVRMDLIDAGIKKRLIKFDDEKKYITYVHQNKKRDIGDGY